MPNVTIDNPKVQIDLAEGASTTVPAGVKWRVTVIAEPLDSLVQLNSLDIIDTKATSIRNSIELDLFGGDTIEATDRQLRIRGYRVD